MRSGYLLLTWFACAAAFAQAPALVQDNPPADPRRNQKVERLHTEDSDVAIDEVRYAGQTQSTTVQPKNGMPAYEIQPPTPDRQRLQDDRRGNTGAGARVWNVFQF
jgi:hypothetical protein